MQGSRDALNRAKSSKVLNLRGQLSNACDNRVARRIYLDLWSLSGKVALEQQEKGTPMNRFISNCFKPPIIALLCLLPARPLLATSFTLTIQTNGSGTVNLNPSLSAYPSNSVVTVTATPNGGWYFVG